jgi:hypothetical protein
LPKIYLSVFFINITGIYIYIMKISAQLIKSDTNYIARCPELDINCYGANKREALKRLRNVIQFYIDSAKELGMEIDGIVAVSINGEPNDELVNPPVYSTAIN